MERELQRSQASNRSGILYSRTSAPELQVTTLADSLGGLRTMTPSHDSIIDVTINALLSKANELDAEQSVRGIDALQELQVHALLEDAFTAAALGVHREAHYPSQGDAYTKATNRNRCDFAFTGNQQQSLIDPAQELKQLALAQDTLFAASATSPHTPENSCPPDQAYWLEIKVCAQHAYRDGVPSPNPKYDHEIINGLQSDIHKLSTDEHIWHAGAMIVLFTENDQFARHDLSKAAQVCIDQGLPVRSPLIATESINDRAGNGCVAVGLFPIST